MRSWIKKHRFPIFVITLTVLAVIVFAVDPLYRFHYNSAYTIHRKVQAYTHENGTTSVYYKDGGVSSIPGEWYFTDPNHYYELWRDPDSNIWHVDPYR